MPRSGCSHKTERWSPVMNYDSAFIVSSPAEPPPGARTRQLSNKLPATPWTSTRGGVCCGARPHTEKCKIVGGNVRDRHTFRIAASSQGQILKLDRGCP